MFNRYKNNGDRVKISNNADVFQARGKYGRIRSNFVYDGRIEVEFEAGDVAPLIIGSNSRIVRICDLEVV